MKFLKNNHTNWLYILLIIVMAFLVEIGIFEFSKKETEFNDSNPLEVSSEKNENPQSSNNSQKTEKEKEITNLTEFRNSVVKFVRQAAVNFLENKDNPYPQELEIEGNWDIKISAYLEGKLEEEGRSQSENGFLAPALEKTVQETLKNPFSRLKENIEKTVFLITFNYNSSKEFSFVEYKNQGKEVQKGLVIYRDLNKEIIEENIQEAKEFLFRAQNEETGGFYKKYDALNDDFGNIVHAVYSASIVYTLLKIYDYDKDPKILEAVSEGTDFLLFMQNRDETDLNYGAFHYSYDLNKEEKEEKFVVGTAALSIFTLLDLYQREEKRQYLEAARLAGNWLITMQKEDGSMQSYRRKLVQGNWYESKQESLLYNGQVLSAFSRLYRETEEEKYFQSAQKIAQKFVNKVAEEGCYLGDDYRIKNPISSAWVVMSLWDFYKIEGKKEHRDIILRCSQELLKRQSQNKDDPLSFGSFNGAYSSSGNGWLAEVMMEMYYFCQEEKQNDCNNYKEGIIKIIFWLNQNTYTQENSFSLPNSQISQGGLFWNYKDKYVRTDSICHGVNAYVGVINDLDDQFYFALAEKDFETVLESLKN